MKRSFKNYGFFDVSKLKKIIDDAKFDWDEYDYRQKKHDAHKETKTIPILWDESLSLKSITKTKYYHLFEDEITKLEKHLVETIDEDGFILRALLINLPAHKSIKRHLDLGETLTIPRRIHLPIITNKKCIFSVGDVDKNLKEGEIWEIDNDGKMHSVHNDGDQDRIHLLVDFMKID